MRTLVLLVVVCSSGLAAAWEEEKRAMTDEQKIQGTWELVSGERHGKAFSDDVLKNVTLTFAGDVLTTKNKDRANDAKFRLHPDLKVKGIDLVMDGNVGKGIYSLEGDDLKILQGEVGDPRPTKFDPKGSPTFHFFVLKRRR